MPRVRSWDDSLWARTAELRVAAIVSIVFAAAPRLVFAPEDARNGDFWSAAVVVTIFAGYSAFAFVSAFRAGDKRDMVTFGLLPCVVATVSYISM